MHCRLGRTCRADDRGRTSCVCAEPDHCAVHRRGTRNHGRVVAEGDGGTSRWGVCGSNGKFYSSHCEMHRQACITGEHIRANSDRRACSEKGRSLGLTVTAGPAVRKVGRISISGLCFILSHGREPSRHTSLGQYGS